jgi:hypothetical protein
MTLPRNARKDASSVVPRADRLMKRRLFAEAIALYEERVAAVPTDLASLLKLGICHLLNRSEKRFLKIYLQGKERMTSLSDRPAETVALWRKYEDLAVKVAGGALVIGSLAIGGSPPALAGTPDIPSGTPPGVAIPAPIDPGTWDCAKPPTPRPHGPEMPTTKYGGGAFRPPVMIEPPQEPITDGPPPAFHKYAAGAYPDEWRK